MKAEPAFQKLAEFVESLTGVYIQPEKYYLFEHRLTEVLREFHIPDFTALLTKLGKETQLPLLNRIIEKITTHETFFFRDEKIFLALAEQIIPEWKERNLLDEKSPRYPPLHIWSAACATGQEPYSIAMVIAERHPDLLASTRITATDIAEDSLTRARSGSYSNFELSRGLSEKYRSKYFTIKENNFVINKDLLPPVEFCRHNLVSDSIAQKYDIVFCRNVLYYFSEKSRKTILAKLQGAIKPEGVLVLGSAESCSNGLTNYITREFQSARYYELNTANVTLFQRKNYTS